MSYITDSVKQLFSLVSNKAHIKFHYSPLVITIEDIFGTFDAYYGFYSTGAIRIEANGDEIIGVSVYNSPQDLNKPSFRVNLTNIDPAEEVDTIVSIISGRGNSLVRVSANSSMFEKKLDETSKDDINEFMMSIGGYAYSKKLSSLFHSFLQWADVNDRRVIPSSYFSTLAKEWLIVNGKGKYKDIEVTKGSEEITQVNSAQEDDFITDIFKNEIYYKATMAEHVVKRIMLNDPLVNAFFLCGSPGMGKTTTVVKVAKQFPDFETKVVYKKGTIRGFTGLLQLLWDNRKNKVIILDDCDNLLKDNDKNFSATSILKAALDTQESGRIISYVRAKKNPIPGIKESVDKLEEVSTWFDAVPNTKEPEVPEEPEDETQVPDEFMFESKMIFISNQMDIPPAIGDRCLAIQLNYTKEEALAMIEEKLTLLCPEYPDLSLDDKKEVLKFMRQHKAQATSISYRSFIHIAVLFMSHDPHWMQWALIQLRNPVSA
jgi:hypothetical protein